ncbi:hypothetical protein FQA39_LY17428 [Lamprigera yunnana]|nr:hypothetical protein FQA39_LY17428 [Lamprigera yunnana]
MSKKPVRKHLSHSAQCYEYHVRVVNAFQKDCERFLQQFELKKNITFKDFADVWESTKFGLIYSGQELVEELRFFTETSFFTLKKFITFSETIAIQVGAFYLLYAMYYKQPTKVKIRIRLTLDDYKSLQKLTKVMEKWNVMDGLFIFTKLKLEGAFRLVATHQIFALERKYMWQERALVNDIFKTRQQADVVADVKEILNSDDFYGMKSIYKMNSSYAAGLRKYGFSADVCEKVVNFSEIENILSDMECDHNEEKE